MNLYNLFKISIRAVGNNKMRSFLSMLGIIIGVAAVIIMMSIGQGSKESIRSELSTMGTNLLTIRPGADMRGGVRQDPSAMQTLKMADYQRIIREKKFVTKVSPEVTASGQVVYGNNNTTTTIYGESTEYLDIKQWPVERGDCFTEEDINKAAKKVVVGKTIVTELFGEGADPIGKTIRFKSIPMTIVGVLKAKGYNSWGMDQDNVIIAPYTTVMKRIAAQTWFSSIVCSAITEDLSDAAIEDDGDHVNDHGHGDTDPRGGCRLLPPGGRYRHHEYHAGERHRAYQGDWSPHGRRCHGCRHLPAVPHRVCAYQCHGRTVGYHRRMQCQRTAGTVVWHAQQRTGMEHLRLLPRVCYYRRWLRLCTGRQSRPYGSYRSYPS